MAALARREGPPALVTVAPPPVARVRLPALYAHVIEAQPLPSPPSAARRMAREAARLVFVAVVVGAPLAVWMAALS